jgi:hypothetical protein
MCTRYKIYYCDQIKWNEVGRACSMRRIMRNIYINLVGKSERRRSLRKLRRRWEDKIKIDPREIG